MYAAHSAVRINHTTCEVNKVEGEIHAACYYFYKLLTGSIWKKIIDDSSAKCQSNRTQTLTYSQTHW